MLQVSGIREYRVASLNQRRCVSHSQRRKRNETKREGGLGHQLGLSEYGPPIVHFGPYVQVAFPPN